MSKNGNMYLHSFRFFYIKIHAQYKPFWQFRLGVVFVKYTKKALLSLSYVFFY